MAEEETKKKEQDEKKESEAKEAEDSKKAETKKTTEKKAAEKKADKDTKSKKSKKSKTSKKKTSDKSKKSKTSKKSKKNKGDDRNTVYIGSKPFMNYVTAVVMQFTTQNSDKVRIKSRGKFINKAVDVAEVVKRRFMSGQIAVEEVLIGSESFENREGREVNVSTIDVGLMKSE